MRRRDGAMRFSTGSSSSSVASDSLSRKSTLCIYTEDAPSLPCEKMDSGSEAMELRRELEAVRSALHAQSQAVLNQRHQLVEAGHKLASRDRRADTERRMRQDQLALVLRSLVLLESRLTREQRQIRLALHRKETIIKTQQEEIGKLKARKLYCSNCQQMLGFTSEQTNIETDPEFQSLESTDSRSHGFMRSCSYHERIVPPVFQKNTRLSKSFQLPKHDVVYGNTSSSEEGNQSGAAKGTYAKNKQAFVRKDVVRRSRKFSGRKHNSSYLENIKRNSSQANSSSAEECIGMSYQVNEESTANPIVGDIPKSSEKIDWLTEEPMNQTSISEKTHDKTFACKIENLHGIKRQTSVEINANRTVFLNNVLNEDSPSEKPWYVNVSDPEPEIENNYAVRSGKLSYTKSKSADNLLVAGFNDGILNAEVISARNEVLCNNLTKNIKRDKFGQIKIYDSENLNTNVANSKEFASEANENWYASASDADDGPSCEIYKNNPVLECVNQILLQNSLDESSNDTSKSSDVPSPKASAKRVQFSTLNSISFDDTAVDGRQSHTLPRQSGHDRRANKIVKFSLETASEHSYEVPNTAQGFNYEIQSIYSNDYEPIVTKSPESHRPVPLPRTMTTNFTTATQIPIIKGSLVKNMTANIENRNNTTLHPEQDVVPMKIVNKRKVPRTPPALPPKPKNLVSKFKFEKDSTVRPSTEINSDAVAANQRVAEVKTRKVGQLATVSNAVEPDYCSISEINVPVVSNGKRELLLSQPTVEIHNEQYPTQPVSPKNNIAKVVSLPRILNKVTDNDIPMLPQVTEIIIPDEDDSEPNSKEMTSPTIGGCDSYMLNSLINQTPPKQDQRNSIQMGNSVSNILSEINRGGSNADKLVLTELDTQYNHAPKDGAQKLSQKPQELTKSEYFDDIDRFDLSQNFEEFKIDECDMGSIVAEEYRISSGSSDGAGSDIVTEDVTATPSEISDSHTAVTVIDNIVNNNYRIEIISNNNVPTKQDIEIEFRDKNDSSLNKVFSKSTSKLSNKPDLLSNIENLETDSLRNSDIESSNSSGSNSGSYNTVKCEPGTYARNNNSAVVPTKNSISFDFFLESSGLSSKSIITASKTFAAGLPPARPPCANHKSVLKPKDIKMRVKNPLTTNKINEKPMTTAIKYFEPYL